jgi:hypothetical protein
MWGRGSQYLQAVHTLGILLLSPNNPPSQKEKEFNIVIIFKRVYLE